VGQHSRFIPSFSLWRSIDIVEMLCAQTNPMILPPRCCGLPAKHSEPETVESARTVGPRLVIGEHVSQLVSPHTNKEHRFGGGSHMAVKASQVPRIFTPDAALVRISPAPSLSAVELKTAEIACSVTRKAFEVTNVPGKIHRHDRQSTIASNSTIEFFQIRRIGG
jgi:hypothetical protein